MGTPVKSADFSRGNTNKLVNKIDGQLKVISDNVKVAAEASERHAGRLLWATWALAFATLVLVAVTRVRAYTVWFTHAG